MALMQGGMMVTEYEVKFVQLSQYVPELIPDERARCDRFRFGLLQEVKMYLLVL